MEARDLLTARPRPFELSLRIRHPSIDPAEISQQLSVEAEHSFKAGDPRQSDSGLAAAALHAESYWLATLDPAEWPSVFTAFDMTFPGRPRLAFAKEGLQNMMTDSLGVALTVCTSFFLNRHADFVRRVQTEGGEVTLIVSVSPDTVRGFTLSPQIGRALSDLGVPVEFEFGNG